MGCIDYIITHLASFYQSRASEASEALLAKNGDNRKMVELIPGFMPGPICVKLSGVAGVRWESDLGKKRNFFIDLEIFF